MTDKLTKILKLVEEAKVSKQTEPDGTYVAVKLTQDSVDAIQKFIKDHNIPNAVTPNKLHSTLMYSRKYLPDLKSAGKLEQPYVGNPLSLDVWDSQDGSRCLVLKLDSDDLSDRHKYLMQQNDGATWDHPDFTPHVTLSYDIGDMDIDDLLDDINSIGQIKFDNEYDEDLNLNWADNSTKEEQ